MQRVKVKNIDLYRSYTEQNQSVIVMASHQANWEWLQLVNAAILTCAVDAVYRPLSNPFFERLMLSIRTRFNSYPLPMNKIARELINRQSITRVIALVADQSPAPETAYWTTFLNQETPFYTGAAKIAQRTGYPVFFTTMKRVKRGYYEVDFLRLPDSSASAALIERYAREVEKAIRTNPAEWLWSHNRWKHKRG